MDFEKLREKYVKYFDRNRIFPIPELVEQVKPKTISFVITDLKTQRLAGYKKGDLRGITERSRNPGEILLPTQFCHLGCVTTIPGTGSQAGRREYKLQILQAPARIHGETTDPCHRV